MNNKELQKVTSYIFEKYNYQKEKEKEGFYNPTYDYVEYIDSSLKQLDEDSYRILYYDFIKRNRKYWWNDYYSRSTYYRLKGDAMLKFINCLNNQKML